MPIPNRQDRPIQNRQDQYETSPMLPRRSGFPDTLANNNRQDWINAVLAIWLFISPWVLQFGSGVRSGAPGAAAPGGPIDAVYSAAWNAWVLGVIVFLVAVSAAARRQAWQSSGKEWITLLLGIWIFIAPWVLGFAAIGNKLVVGNPLGNQTAAWDHWIVGFLIFIVSLWNLSTMRRATPAI